MHALVRDGVNGVGPAGDPTLPLTVACRRGNDQPPPQHPHDPPGEQLCDGVKPVPLPGGGKTPTVSDLWPGLAVHFLRRLVERTGLARAVERRGFSGLLKHPCIRASVGYFIALIHGQVVSGKKPDQGDSRDLFHVTSAAAVGGILVTHDQALTRNVRSIPGLSLRALSLPEFVAEL
jgi:hypothetical protein